MALAFDTFLTLEDNRPAVLPVGSQTLDYGVKDRISLGNVVLESCGSECLHCISNGGEFEIVRPQHADDAEIPFMNVSSRRQRFGLDKKTSGDKRLVTFWVDDEFWRYDDDMEVLVGGSRGNGTVEGTIEHSATTFSFINFGGKLPG